MLQAFSEINFYVMSLFNEIPGYEGYYEIDRKGSVRSIKRVIKTEKGNITINSKNIKPRNNNNGYLEIRLSKDGKTKTKFIHRLLAMTYINNINNKPEVNHINGTKLDNRLDNLEWVTKSENMQHAYKTGLIRPKGIKVIDKVTGEEFTSIKLAAKKRNINYQTMQRHLSGKVQKVKHFLQYKEAA